MRNLLKGVAVNIVRLFTLLWLTCHFVLTIIYVFPLNPVKMATQPILDATIGQFFAQNWSLFAPNPVTTTQSLLARCLTEDETPRGPSDPLPTDQWRDISSPLFNAAQVHRLSAYERVVRPQQNALRQYLTGGWDLQVYQDSCKKGEKRACEFFEAILKVRRVEASSTLQKIGSAFCRESLPRQQPYGVALRLRERSSVPWSERDRSIATTKDYDLGVFPIDQTTALPRLYLKGVEL